MDSMSEYGMIHSRRGGGFTSGEEDEDMSDNAINSASESGAERANYGEELQKIKRKRKKIVAPVATSSSSVVPTLYEIAKRHRNVSDEDEDDDFDDNMVHLDENEYRELFKIPYKSVFTKIVTNEAERALIEPYLHMNSEQQEKFEQEMLAERLKKQRKVSKDLTKLTATSRFARIDDHLRVGLRRASNLYFILQLEEILRQYLTTSIAESNTEVPLVVAFSENFYRFLCHGICQYYCLTSYSVDYQGERVTVILMPKNDTITVPSLHLYKYLHEVSGYTLNLESEGTTTDLWKVYDPNTFMSDHVRTVNHTPSSQTNGGSKKKKFRKSKAKTSFGVKQY